MPTKVKKQRRTAQRKAMKIARENAKKPKPKLKVKTGSSLQGSLERNRASALKKKRTAPKPKPKVSTASRAMKTGRKVARSGPAAVLTALSAAAEHRKTPQGQRQSRTWSTAGSGSAAVRSGKSPTVSKPKPKPKAKPKAAPKPTRKAKQSTGGMGKFGRGAAMTVKHKGREMANVDSSQLKATGLSLRAYMNQWKKTGKRPTGKK